MLSKLPKAFTSNSVVSPKQVYWATISAEKIEVIKGGNPNVDCIPADKETSLGT